MAALSNEVVFITGASSGFGAATARRLAREGARLVLAARRLERLEALASELGVPCHVVQLDVRDRDAVNAAVAALPPAFAEPTVLVNNAGLALGLDKVHEASNADWDEMVDTNVKGLLNVTQAVLPGMVKRNRGYVVNMGSIAASYPYPGGHVYCGSKAFVHQFSLAMRADLVGTKVRVTCIEPGLCETEFSLVRFHGDAERAKKVYQGADPITAVDIAETIHWLVTRPPHLNVNLIEMMPVTQAFSSLTISRS